MANTLNFGAGKWAAKAGSVLAYNSENNNFKPLPFTFTRASSATRVNESGLIESVGSGIPRIDFLNNADGHLLLEPSRTNVALYSEQLDNASWVKSGSGVGVTPVVTANDGISPDGNQNADRIDLSLNGGTSSSDWSWVYRTYSVIANQPQAFSIYLKAATAGDVGKQIRVGFISYLNHTLTADWTRVVLNQTVGSNGDYSVGFRLRGSETTVNTASFYAWGAQLEQNASYATSYIPTSGSSVTRVADAATQLPPSGILNNAKGTMFLSFRRPTGSLDFSAFGVSDGTTNNEAFFRLTTEDTIEYYVRSGGAQTVSFGYTSADLNVPVKIAVVYDTNYAAMYVNGILVGPDLTVTAPATINRIHFTRGNGTLNFVGEVFAAQYYNEVLSASQLIALTS